MFVKPLNLKRDQDYVNLYSAHNDNNISNDNDNGRRFGCFY